MVNTTKVTWGNLSTFDTRVKLKVPHEYVVESPTETVGPVPGKYYNLGLDGQTETHPLSKHDGIIFPYTPGISFDTAANYTAQSLIHSNYNFYSYKNSSVGAINLSAKFVVQNNADAGFYLAVQHLLRALIKMPWGTDSGPFLAGSPPPICRLFAYGPYMLNNIPVVVTSLKTDYPDGVDYYETLLAPGYNTNDSNSVFGQNMVPILSTMNITLLPVYSRYEQYNFSVKKFLNGELSGFYAPGRGYI
jgi:hypothetical protein